MRAYDFHPEAEADLNAIWDYEARLTTKMPPEKEASLEAKWKTLGSTIDIIICLYSD